MSDILMYEGAGPDRNVSHEQFRQLLAEMIESDYLAMPFGIGTGQIQKDPSRACDAILEGKGRGITVEYVGEDAKQLLEVFARLPYGQVDIGVAFSCLNWEHKLMEKYFSDKGYANAGVLFCARAKPMQFSPMSGRISMQYYMATGGKNGPQEIDGAPFEPIVAKYFGGKKSRKWGMSGF